MDILSTLTAWLTTLPQQSLLLVAGCAGAFVLGVVFSRVLAGKRAGVVDEEDPRNRRIRELEVDLRVVQRKLEDAMRELEDRSEQAEQSMATVRDLNQLLEARDQEVEGLREEVKGAVRKTRELRRELTERAEETLREHVRAEEAKIELDVIRAGSDALVSEFTRTQQESTQEAAADTETAERD